MDSVDKVCACGRGAGNVATDCPAIGAVPVGSICFHTIFEASVRWESWKNVRSSGEEN